MNLLELPLSLSANARPKRCGCVAIACGVAWRSNLFAFVHVHGIYIAFTLPGLVLCERFQLSGWVSWPFLHLVRFLLSLCCWVCVVARMCAWLIPLGVFPTLGSCR